MTLDPFSVLVGALLTVVASFIASVFAISLIEPSEDEPPTVAGYTRDEVIPFPSERRDVHQPPINGRGA